jgi:hypothetical protein
MSQSVRSAAISTLISVLCLGAFGCGQEEVPYKARGANSGSRAALPPAANLPKRPIKNGDTWSVWGASYSLRSRVHRKEVANKRLAIAGYIVKSNMADAPACAVHKAGKADAEDCKAPVPAFWIGDTKDAAEADCIKVMGWASNFAQIFDAIDEFDKGKDNAEYNDANWGVKVPNPLPAVGSKVTVTGQYGVSFSKASSGAEADPFMGVMDFQEMSIQEPAAELATLPGKKRKEKK